MHKLKALAKPQCFWLGNNMHHCSLGSAIFIATFEEFWTAMEMMKKSWNMQDIGPTPPPRVSECRYFFSGDRLGCIQLITSHLTLPHITNSWSGSTNRRRYSLGCLTNEKTSLLCNLHQSLSSFDEDWEEKRWSFVESSKSSENALERFKWVCYLEAAPSSDIFIKSNKKNYSSFYPQIYFSKPNISTLNALMMILISFFLW